MPKGNGKGLGKGGHEAQIYGTPRGRGKRILLKPQLSRKDIAYLRRIGAIR